MNFEVMVVDDDPSIRDLLRGALEMWGYSSFVASSACEAMMRVREHAELQLLITDINMPGMDGNALARIVRQERPGLPIVALTGETVENDELFEHVLIKPVFLETLESVISRYVQKKTRLVAI